MTSGFHVQESDDKKTVTMKICQWSLTCPAADLPGWLQFYRGLIRKRPHTQKFYGAAVDAITAAMERLGVPVPKEVAEKRKAVK